jgi:hypothetical protein
MGILIVVSEAYLQPAGNYFTHKFLFFAETNYPRKPRMYIEGEGM